MKDKQPQARRSRLLRRLNTPSALGLLAIVQAVILVLLLLNLLTPNLVAEAPDIQPPSAANPVTLSFAVPPLEVEKNSWIPLIQAFESKNPDIKIKVVPGSNDTDALKAAYTTEFKNADAKAANASYDLIYTDVIWVAEFASAGWLRELPPIPQAELDLFLPQEVEAGRYQGKLYRMPFRADAGLLYYRKDLLEAAGYAPPQTFDELLTIARDLQAQKRVKWGLVWQAERYEGLVANFFEVLQGFGGFWINPSLEVGLDQPEAIAAARFLLNTITEGISPEEVTTFIEEDAIAAFGQNQAAFLRNWSYAWQELQTKWSLSENQIGVLPVVHLPGTSGGACRGGWGFAVAQRTQNQSEAFRAIRFFVSEAAQRQFLQQNSYVPTIKKLFTDPEIVQKYPYFPELANRLEAAVFRPAIPQYDLVSDKLQDYLSKMLRGHLTPEAAMQNAARETRQILKAEAS